VFVFLFTVFIGFIIPSLLNFGFIRNRWNLRYLLFRRLCLRRFRFRCVGERMQDEIHHFKL